MPPDHDHNPQCWSYNLGNGWTALAGKTAEDNDCLSLRVAHPEDYWFHVAGQPGSHVILRRPPDDQDAVPDKALLTAAAAIAAWHSKARQGGVCSVSCTKAKFVGKPHGAPPGTVSVSHERILRVRPGLPN
ncbi:MAG: DUF814 domain-containing protein [Lentisphaerae bacterium]|jgi:predicted ribosome quality control (RQC) complex YloA/Tae2 family protein|nr:DUF814 domain-containing protein [Lentisphaerota bacterium]